MRIKKCDTDFAYAECIPKKVKTIFKGEVGSCSVLHSAATTQVMIAETLECLHPYPTYGILCYTLGRGGTLINLDSLLKSLEGLSWVTYKKSIYHLLKPFIDDNYEFDLEKWKKEQQKKTCDTKKS